MKEAKVGSIMPGHHDMEGIPCHMNTWLLDDLLRKKCGFDGFVVSDNIDVYRLYAMYHVAVTPEEAAMLGLKAGVDMDLVLGRGKGSYNSGSLKSAIEKDPELSENSIEKSESVEVTVEVKNSGDRGRSEVVQLYIKDVESKYPVANKALRDFKRIYPEPGESQMVSFILKPTDFRVIDDEGNRFVEPGEFDILIGGNSVDLKKITLTVGQ